MIAKTATRNSLIVFVENVFVNQGYVGDGKTCVPALFGKCSACAGQ
jgi:hypothetical protein